MPTDTPVDLLESSDRPLREVLHGRVLDVSKHGLKVRFWHDAKPGAHFSLNIQHNGTDSLCVGEVMWKREATDGMVFGLRVRHWTLLDPSLERVLRKI